MSKTLKELIDQAVSHLTGMEHTEFEKFYNENALDLEATLEELPLFGEEDYAGNVQSSPEVKIYTCNDKDAHSFFISDSFADLMSTCSYSILLTDSYNSKMSFTTKSSIVVNSGNVVENLEATETEEVKWKQKAA